MASSPAFAKELGKFCSQDAAKQPLIFPSTCPAAYAFLVGLLANYLDKRRETPQQLWVVADSQPVQERIAAEIKLWTPLPCIFVPRLEWQVEQSVADPDSTAERLDALYTISGKPEKSRMILVCAESLQDAVPRFSTEKREGVNLRVGMDNLPPEELIELLMASGFERNDRVVARNQWSRRGGIIDVFAIQNSNPLRIEYFGNEIESIREFDVDSQLSIRRLQTADLLLCEPEKQTTLRDLILPEDCVVALPGSGVEARVVVHEIPPFTDEGLPAELRRTIDDDALSFFPTPLGAFDSGDFVMQEARRRFARSNLLRWRQEKQRIVMYFPHESEQKRFEEICGEDTAWSAVQARIGDLPAGFSVPTAKLVVLSSTELFGRRSMAVRNSGDSARAARLRSMQSQVPLQEIQPGDLVIHAAHGLAKFIGIVRDAESGEEELHLEYADNVLLRIPIRQAYLISRYIGLGSKQPKLNKLGDARWQRACRAAQNAVADYAAQLLEVQAQRETATRTPHPPDSSWMKQFEASFPFRETPDQLEAIRCTKRDMESPTPMDRLICGDVGFGKTEVALRAVFKCVTGGHQAAVLAPTTVLADQHFRTFRERMSEYPIRIELLSRLTPAKRATKIIAGLLSGEVDVVIGTHRLLSKNVSFKQLGLVVVDEEQRFGVLHKEQFKRKFRMVDMLTLSATPIPRTLYVALMGAKDMSTINTAPPTRLPVQTTVCPYSEDLIKKAIENEMARGGQVFFLHNRIESIDLVARMLHRLAPQAHIAKAHGRMGKEELELIMRDFVQGKADILLCTSIIESGIDIPNANTMIIDRADRFGLADLYQLRGRVGRSNQHAYAFLLLPPEELCTGDARKRVAAIKQYTALGSGFKIAMRDLEIRGAGNLLGTQQSGHIAAIGFDLYCQLLRQSIEKLRGVNPSPRIDAQVKADFLCLSETLYVTGNREDDVLGAFIPSSYVDSTRARMECYSMLAQTNNFSDVDEIERNWRDRYGILPPEANHLLSVQKIKIAASKKRISLVEIRGQRLMLTRNDDYILFMNRFPQLQKKNSAEKLVEARLMIASL